MPSKVFDYIIVGAGSAGCVLANRLSEEATVLLVEAGPSELPAGTASPDEWTQLVGSPVDWSYASTPQAGLFGRTTHMAHGLMVGGSSELNGMLWTRGDRTDYDGWARDGALGWGYADLEPYFRRIEGYAGDAAPHLGAAGPLHLTSTAAGGVHPIARDFLAATSARGHRDIGEFNGPDGVAGAGFFTMNTFAGRRFSARAAYLDPAMARENLDVWPNSRVVRVNLDGSRCVGVTALRAGIPEVVRARREVILSASAVESPKLLLLSGIGPQEHLQDMGVPIRHVLPGVGANFHDHIAATLQFNQSGDEPLKLLDGAALFFRSAADWVGADLELILFGAGPAGIMLRIALLRPFSAGSVRLRSSDPAVPPVVDPAFLASDADTCRMVQGVREALALASTDPLSAWISGLGPNDGLRADLDDDGLAAWLRCNSVPSDHIAGSCRMGLDEMAVLDPALRVRGLDGLRVVDVSVMPTVVSGHTQAGVMAIAERISDVLLGRQVEQVAGSGSEIAAPA